MFSRILFYALKIAFRAPRAVHSGCVYVVLKREYYPVFYPVFLEEIKDVRLMLGLAIIFKRHELV